MRQHGKKATYNSGCHCDECKKAHREWTKRHRALLKKQSKCYRCGGPLTGTYKTCFNCRMKSYNKRHANHS